jgi:Zn-dependent peptidase ImmA (M78 family)
MDDDARSAAAQVIENNYIEEPPVAIIDLARNYGLEVKSADFGAQSSVVSGYINPATKTILVNQDDPPTRQAFTVAHELGHWRMHQLELHADPDTYAILYRRPLGGPNGDPVERQANTFAANVLVPKKMLEKYKDHVSRAELADIFGVSQEVIGYRLKNEFPSP